MDNKKKELREISANLKEEIKKVREALGHLDENISKFQGNGQPICWNGENAYAFINAAVSQIQHNYDLLEDLDKCSEYVETLTE